MVVATTSPFLFLVIMVEFVEPSGFGLDTVVVTVVPSAFSVTDCVSPLGFVSVLVVLSVFPSLFRSSVLVITFVPSGLVSVLIVSSELPSLFLSIAFSVEVVLPDLSLFTVTDVEPPFPSGLVVVV